MTEITPAAWNRPGDVERVGSIGRPGEGIEFRLVDSDGRAVKSGEVGEICVEGPRLMTGYWQDPDATAAAVGTAGSMPRPLDVMRTAFIRLLAQEGDHPPRRKILFPAGGRGRLFRRPAVSEVGVVGRPDHIWGEVVVAFVVLRSGQAVAEAELIAFARPRLADYKHRNASFFGTNSPKAQPEKSSGVRFARRKTRSRQ